jgi:hypothetical protein
LDNYSPQVKLIFPRGTANRVDMPGVSTEANIQSQRAGTATWRRLDSRCTESCQAPINRTEDRRLRLHSGTAAPAGAAVRIDKDDSLLLGEVIGCRQEGEGWEMLVQIDQVIPSIPDLAQLVRAIVGPAQRESDRRSDGVPARQDSR